VRAMVRPPFASGEPSRMLRRMPGRRLGRPVIAVLALLAVGCSTGSPAASADPSVEPSAGASAGQAGDLPPGCEPIDIRGPSGVRVDLDGTWTAEAHTSSLPETWWIRTQGDCLWGAGAVGRSGDAELFESPDPGRVQIIRGTIGADFVMEGEIVQVGEPGFVPGAFRLWSPLRLFVEFADDGTIVLREDRVRGDPGPRCPEPTSFCIPILVLRPAGETAD
jgi:hypothetical protein